MTTKVELATEILKKNKGKSRKDIIALFMKEADLSHAAASTYYYNLTKGTERKEAAVKKTAAALNLMKSATKTVETASKAVAKRPSRSKAAVAARKTASAGGKDFEPYELSNGDVINLNDVPAFLRK